MFVKHITPSEVQSAKVVLIQRDEADVNSAVKWVWVVRRLWQLTHTLEGGRERGVVVVAVFSQSD